MKYHFYVDKNATCCGMFTVYNFLPLDLRMSTETVELDLYEECFVNAIDRGIRKCKGDWDGEDQGMYLCEAILTNSQLRNRKHIAPLLEKYGFQKVSSFVNMNSENTCNVFHAQVDPHYFKRIE